VPCQTTLIATYRSLYSDALAFEGKRAIVLDAAAPLPRDAVAECIALGLTYHRRKRPKSR